MNTTMLADIHPVVGIPFVVILVTLAVVVAIWDGVWKLIALWKSARNGHLAWFICLAIFNTAGILPIIYILIYREKNQQQAIAV